MSETVGLSHYRHAKKTCPLHAMGETHGLDASSNASPAQKDPQQHSISVLVSCMVVPGVVPQHVLPMVDWLSGQPDLPFPSISEITVGSTA